MTKLERVEAVLNGKTPDRQPASFWRHFYREEQTPEGLAEAMIGFQKKFDWDFVKVNPRASYHAEAFGRASRQSGPNAKREMAKPPVQRISDWKTIKPAPVNSGVLGDHLSSLEIIRETLGEDVHILMTIFNPVSVAGNLCADPKSVLAHFDEDPNSVRGALRVITETFATFAEACLKSGASGIFFATTVWATSEFTSWEKYEELARPYDMEFLRSLSGKSRFTLLHVCRSQSFLKKLLDYPVHAFNWDAADPTNPALAEIAGMAPRAVIGGLDQSKAFTELSPEEVAGAAGAVAAEMRGKRWILGSGCVLPAEAREANLKAIRNLLEAVS